jgi:hypothetical protein
MKRLVSIFLALAFLFMATDAIAQSVKLKRYAKTMNMKTGTKVWEYNTGLKIVGKGTKAYIKADTTGSGATPVTSFSWTFDKRPTGSVAVMDSGASHPMDNSFTVDSVGYYYLSVSVNGGAKVSRDTVYASTYIGVNRYDPFNIPNGCFCHLVFGGEVNAKFAEWQNSNHAMIFYRGVTGQLETEAVAGVGVYKESCVQCHTTGFEVGANNGNWAYLARNLYGQFDTSWANSLPLAADGSGDAMIKTGDTTLVWSVMNTGLRATANIGCENCHGPMRQHVLTANKQYVDITLEPDVCNVCHDGSTKHSVGSYFRGALHAKQVTENGSGCAPCHTGASFVYYAKNGRPLPFPSAAYDAPTMDNTNTTCAVCHDPHTMELRVTTLDSLMNGYRPPAGTGGAGVLCMNCHHARSNSLTYVKPNSPPYYGFKARFYPHHSNQTDMLFGRNGYDFGDSKLMGINTHLGLPDGCVTCHMGMRNGLPNHTFTMDPADPNYTLLGGARNYNPVTACQSCHGMITSYDDITAAYDYDRDGIVEGVESEVEGMMETLKAKLPKTAAGDVVGEGSVTAADSAAVMNRLDLVEGIWTYWFVEMDASGGMHNAKYTIALLQKALGLYPLSVERADLTTPASFALNQNYPNPFNPTTTISFSLPQSGQTRLDVYDVLGKHVTTLLDENMGAGNFRVTWDGMDKNGSKVASGMYIYRIQSSNNFTAVKKMLMVK